MLTTEDKQFLHKTYATKDDLRQTELRLNEAFEERMSRQLGVHLEAMDTKFKLYTEVMMAYIDKKIEPLQSHENRITKVERRSSFNRADTATHNWRLKRLER